MQTISPITQTPLNNSTQVSAAAPVKNDKVFSINDHFVPTAIDLYFERVIGTKTLKENETIRLTYDKYSYSADTQSTEMFGVVTQKFQIKSVEELKTFMNNHTNSAKIPDTIKNQIGYSMSASKYTHEEDRAPGTSSLISTQTFVLDLDARVGADRKSDRYAFNNATLETKQAAAVYMIGLLNSMLADENSLEWFLIPNYIYETGGGLQFIFKYTDDLSLNDASQILNVLKSTLEEKEEKFRNSFKFYMQDIMGIKPVYFEIDYSTFDVTHTQRIGGTRNPKKLYSGSIASELSCDFKSKDFLSSLIENYSKNFKTNSEEIYLDYKLNHEYKIRGALTEEDRIKVGPVGDKQTFDDNIIKYKTALFLNAYNYYVKAAHYYNKVYYSQIPVETYRTYQQSYNDLLELKNTNKNYSVYQLEYLDLFLQNMIIPVQSLLVDCKLSINKHTADNSVNAKIMDPSNIGTYEILAKLTPYQQLQIFRSRLKGEIAGSKYNKYLCPFHDEQNTPSLAVYHLGATSPKNDVPDSKNLYVYDYHDGKSYDVVTFLEALESKERGEPVPKNIILNEIALEYNITLTKSDRKLFNDAENVSKVEELITLIDTDNYMYYRKANKSKDCIIREFEDGSHVKFDGTRMMTDHVLEAYLGVTNVNNEFKLAFHDIFNNKILKNRFEKFKPNHPHEFIEKKNAYVNLWVPGRAYEEVHNAAKDISPMDIEIAIECIKTTLPTSWIFLNQLTQKGSLEYFVNWLACVAQYKVMPTLPILTSVQGTGKNVFVKEWLAYYLNNEYVNIATAEKIQSNFNAFMETSSMIVLDEGDFSRSKEVDQLKLLTGNEYVTVEKKGVDSQQMLRYFNMVMLTNGECPIIHTYDDRRITYFRLEVKLLTTILEAGFTSIESFLDSLRSEVTDFWAILLKTNIKHKWSHNNLQDNVFNKQILLMHPFGKLVLKIIEGDWDYIEFQLNENVHDKLVMAHNNDMINEIKHNYSTTGMIGMDLINKYIQSLNYKVHRNVIEFVNSNQLHRFGIEVVKHDSYMKIKINKDKLLEVTTIKNNLGNLFSKFDEDHINETLNIKKGKDSDNITTQTSSNINMNHTHNIHNAHSTQNSNPLGIPLQANASLGLVPPPIMVSSDPSNM